ncbi:unnamed protein product, partial [Meganyctiphanes norvegica]
VYIRYDFDKDDNIQLLQNFTICYWFKRTSFTTYETHFSYSLRGKNSRKFTNALNFGSFGGAKDWTVTRMDVEPYGRFQLPLTLHTWNHYCHVFTKYKYTLYFDGSLFYNSDGITVQEPLKTNGTLIIGQEQDSSDGSFESDEILKGYISQFNIWNETVDVLTYWKEANDISNFANGNVFSTESNAVMTLNNVAQSNTSFEDFSEMTVKVSYFMEEITFNEASNNCKIIGLNLFFPEKEDILYLHEKMYVTDRSGYNTYVWIDGTDINKKRMWKIDNTNKTGNVSIIGNGAREKNCATINLSENKIEHINCEWHQSYICENYHEATINVRGLCFNNFNDMLFVPISNHSEPILYGLYGY